MFVNKSALQEKLSQLRAVRAEFETYFTQRSTEEGITASQEVYGSLLFSCTGGEDLTLRLYQGKKELFSDVDDLFLYMSELINPVCIGTATDPSQCWPIDGECLFIEPCVSLYFLEQMAQDNSCANLLEQIRVFEEEIYYPIPEHYRTLIAGDNVVAIWSVYDPEDLDSRFLVETKDSYLFYYSGG